MAVRCQSAAQVPSKSQQRLCCLFSLASCSFSEAHLWSLTGRLRGPTAMTHAGSECSGQEFSDGLTGKAALPKSEFVWLLSLVFRCMRLAENWAPLGLIRERLGTTDFLSRS